MVGTPRSLRHATAARVVLADQKVLYPGLPPNGKHFFMDIWGPGLINPHVFRFAYPVPYQGPANQLSVIVASAVSATATQQNLQMQVLVCPTRQNLRALASRGVRSGKIVSFPLEHKAGCGRTAAMG